ncbi:xylulokinase [Paenibacillus luteus]|uniref:xylulokinase n=1 Tax=Paenibacillus luteus TaxID=2545753 RepID=UPI0019D621D0|nr:FGGY family carbohydrate kinase [Paenibacillus luteus]
MSSEDKRVYQECLIGMDIGTSAVKGVLISASGSVVSRERIETQTQVFKDGRIEFDADLLFRLTSDVIRRLVKALPEGACVTGLSIASASGNTMLVNAQGKPMLPAFSWMDERVTNEMESTFGDMEASEVHDLIGWPLLKTFPLAHLSWLNIHEPDLLRSAAKVCMSTDYLNYKLTGAWAMDSSTASTFYLQDQKAMEWHLPFLRKLEIPEEKLPRLLAPGSVLGFITAEAAVETGLPLGMPVTVGSFDHPSAARGAGVLDEGQLLLSCGTSWVGFTPIKDRQSAIDLKLLVDPFLQPNGPWGAMFSLPAIATLVDKYICDYISGAPDRYLTFNELASAANPGASGLRINPMWRGELGGWDKFAKTDIARALMEGTAYLLKMHIDQLDAAGICFQSVTMVGGPSETLPWPQIVADVLGKEVSVINGACAGAAGAAIMAGIGAGLYSDERGAFLEADFQKLVRKPDVAAHEVYKREYRKFTSELITKNGGLSQ